MFKMSNQATSENSVTSFYAGRSIFITGATGFIGKALIEKLLRSCPDIKEIFLLMRPKKGMSIDERLKKILSSPLYDKLRKENPTAFEKLIPVQGDVAVEGLGLPTVERRVLIERVSIIFHVAASVRFDDHLKDAIFVNLRSTRDICILGSCMKKLVALLHVSSTYTQTDKPEVEEKLYPIDVDWRKTIKIAETVDDEILKAFTAKYLGPMPNTYTFTKRLAEQVISDYSKDLPCIIVRLSIVVSTLTEPIEGWMDNFHGPVGLLVGGGKGILRVCYINDWVISDFIPVDVTAKAMLLAAWKRACVTVTKDPSVHVYNCASSLLKGITTTQLINTGFVTNAEIPLEGIVWNPSTMTTNNRMVFYILTIFMHVLPAVLMDGLIKLSGHRPMLVKLQRRIYISNISLAYFILHQWKFRNEKMLRLLDDVPPSEYGKFGFTYYIYDISHFFKMSLIGAKIYLLNESMDNLPNARRHHWRMKWIDRIVKIVLLLLFIYMFYQRAFSYIVSTCDAAIDGVLRVF